MRIYSLAEFPSPPPLGTVTLEETNGIVYNEPETDGALRNFHLDTVSWTFISLLSPYSITRMELYSNCDNTRFMKNYYIISNNNSIVGYIAIEKLSHVDFIHEMKCSFVFAFCPSSVSGDAVRAASRGVGQTILDFDDVRKELHSSAVAQWPMGPPLWSICRSRHLRPSGPRLLCRDHSSSECIRGLR